jgi:hypothetical protein
MARKRTKTHEAFVEHTTRGFFVAIREFRGYSFPLREIKSGNDSARLAPRSAP